MTTCRRSGIRSSRWATRLAVVLSAAVLAPAAPIATARAGLLDPVAKLTLVAPSSVVVGASRGYTGALTLNATGLPLQDVRLLVDGAAAGTATTATDGTYAALATLTTYGTHDVQAVAYAGTPLEVRSPVAHVQAVPGLDETTPTDVYDGSRFLYTGPAAPQTGVAPGAIDPARTAVLRGSVTSRAGQPLDGVVATMTGHPEYGSSTTRGGTLDMVVNGGGPVTVRYEKPGYLPVERAVPVDWHEYEVLPDVVLTPVDPVATVVEPDATETTVARASEVTDDDGTRRATLLFPAGTTASMRLPDGSQEALGTMHVRATEYTVGDAGPEAMPGELPPASGYTYAVDYSVDEARAAGATQVSFDRPVPTYTENFLGFPVGMAVPAGYYDSERHAWIAAPNGRVVEVVAVTGGRASLDVDGDGTADGAAALSALGIGDDELDQLGALYAAGQSLWRVPVTHFTPWDYNWPYGLPPGAVGPDGRPITEPQGQCDHSGSIIGCENQTLGEVLPVVGAPFSLRYDTRNVPGYAAGRAVRVPLVGATVPSLLNSVSLTVTVAGRRFSTSFAPSANLEHTFVWDGKDAYGRTVQGSEQATVRVSYEYQAVYYQPGEFSASFGQVGTAALTANRARREIALAQEWQVPVGGVTSAARQSLGGWGVSVHHTYDPEARTLYLGDGTTRAAAGVFDGLARFAGNGAAGAHGDGTFSGDGGAATSAGLGAVRGVAGAPDGSVYVADAGNGRVRKVGPSGSITTFAGGGSPASGNGDGGPATSAELVTPNDVAVAPDGAVYILDTGAAVVRRVGTDGVITTYAGGGNPADGIGDGPAAGARFASPLGIAAGPGGVVYVADTGHDRLRRIDADGTVTTVAGGGSPADGLGDGLPGPAAALAHPTDVALSRDGEAYVADADHNRVRVVRRDGIVMTFAGNGAPGATGDGGAATAAQVGFPTSLAFDPSDGRLYVAQRLHHRVRAVTTDGTIVTAVGTGTAGSGGDRGLPSRAQLRDPQGVAVAPDGNVYVADTGNFQVRRIVPPLPGFSAGDILVPSSDGTEVYQFDATGRHLRTLDAVTNAVRLVFGYDGAGRLIRVQDSSGNDTTIERNANGVPTAIVSPYGERTVLAVGADGYLSSVANPAGEAHTMTYRAGGLIETFTTPRSETSTMTYDSLGRLTKDLAQDGASTTLARTPTPTGFRVTATTAEGRVTTYETTTSSAGVVRTATSPSGETTTATTGSDGIVRVTDADGTTSSRRLGPDPRWGMQVPIPDQVVVTTPSGRSTTTSAARSVTLADPANPLTVQTQTDSLTLNGKTVTTVWNAAARTMTTTTAAGRTKVSTYDAAGRVLSTQQGTLAPTTFTYDARGRLATVTEGSGAAARTSTFTYNARGLVQSVANPVYTTSYTYDAAGRINGAVLPDGKTVGYGHDADGRRTSVTPPGRTAHTFDWTTGSLVGAYHAPAVAGTGDTTYGYDDDRLATSVALPGGRTVGYDRDAGGRIGTVHLARGDIGSTYDATTGHLTRMDAPGGESLGLAWDGYLLTGTTATGTSSASVGYTFNADLRVASRTLNGGPATAFTYNNDGALTSSGPLSLSWNTANGLLNGTTAGSVTTSNGYDDFGGVTSLSASAGATSLYSVSYVRDKLGRATQRTETVNGVTVVEGYRYDARGRLDRVTRGGLPVVTYAYDDNGNRLSATTATGTTTADYDAQDRLTRYGGTTYTYTANGELATATTAAGTTTYTYDELGNLTHAGLPSGTSIDYVVDPQGRRIGKKVNGTLVQRFVYGQGSMLLAEQDGAGNTVATFGWGSRRTVPDLVTRGGTTYRIVTDHLGSPRAVVNTATGAVVQRLDYDAFGAVVSDTNPGFQPFGFAGGLYDRDTGLVRFGLRDYDAAVGRFTAKDPVGFSGRDPNLYLYVNDDPVNLIDPTGLDWLQSAGDFFAGMGDAVTFGGTRAIRQLIGVDDVVNYCSGWYTGGEVTGVVLLTVVTEGAGAEAEGGLAAEEAAPRIKPGSAGGETAGKPFPESVRQEVLAENPSTCVYCRMETETPQVDHAIPKSRGGNATVDNGQTTCPWCNGSKNNRDFPVNPPPGYEGPWPPPWWFE